MAINRHKSKANMNTGYNNNLIESYDFYFMGNEQRVAALPKVRQDSMALSQIQPEQFSTLPGIQQRLDIDEAKLFDGELSEPSNDTATTPKSKDTR